MGAYDFKSLYEHYGPTPAEEPDSLARAEIARRIPAERLPDQIEETCVWVKSELIQRIRTERTKARAGA